MPGNKECVPLLWQEWQEWQQWLPLPCEGDNGENGSIDDRLRYNYLRITGNLKKKLRLIGKLLF